MARQKLTFDIDANDRKFIQKMGSVKSSAEKTAKKIASIFAIKLSFDAFVGFTKSLIDVGDEIGKASKRMGVSAEEFQKMSFAARRSGASTEAVEAAFKTMQKTIYDAGTGSQSAIDTLLDIGVTLDQLKGKSPEKQFSLIAEALGSVKDAGDKAALAQKIFSEGGIKLIPMLNDYKALSAEMENMGGIISDENIAAAESFKDSMENLGVTIQALVANSGLLEWLAKVAEGMNAFANMDNLKEKTNTQTKAWWDMSGGPALVSSLTPEQQAKWDAMDKEQKRRRQERKRGKEVDYTQKPEKELDEKRLKIIADLGGKEKLLMDELIKLREASSQAEIRQITQSIRKRQAAEEKQMAAREKALDDVKKFQDEIQKYQEETAFADKVDSEKAKIDQWKSKIDETEKKIKETEQKLKEFGGSLEKGLFTSAQDRSAAAADESLKQKIEAKNQGYRVSFSGQDRKKMQQLEQERQAALEMQKKVQEYQNNIESTSAGMSADEKARNIAQRNTQLADLQNKLGVAREAAGQIDNIRKGNEPMVEVMRAISKTLEERLPSAA